MTTYQYCYDEVAKDKFHRAGRKLLKALAKDLGLVAGSFDIRSNKGGIAIFGEITLHHERIYIQISGSVNPTEVLYRSCQGRKDYTGGMNQWTTLEALTDDNRRPRVLEAFKRIINGSAA